MSAPPRVWENGSGRQKINEQNHDECREATLAFLWEFSGKGSKLSLLEKSSVLLMPSVYLVIF